MPRALLVSTTLLMALTSSLPSQAQDFRPAMEEFYTTSLAGLATDATLVAAVVAQNGATGALDQPAIDALDTAWRAEVGTASMPTVTPVITNATSLFLQDLVGQSGGRITEFILMDARGLNVAVSAITSDMWQGDEEKHSQTYIMGPGSVHYSEVELDESTGRYQAQISFTVTDPASGQAVGAITVGVDAESLM